MIRALILLLLSGCAHQPVVLDCSLHAPPAELLRVPNPLPPVPADLRQ
jgi:hypothetical protein